MINRFQLIQRLTDLLIFQQDNLLYQLNLRLIKGPNSLNLKEKTMII